MEIHGLMPMTQQKNTRMPRQGCRTKGHCHQYYGKARPGKGKRGHLSHQAQQLYLNIRVERCMQWSGDPMSTHQQSKKKMPPLIPIWPRALPNLHCLKIFHFTMPKQSTSPTGHCSHSSTLPIFFFFIRIFPGSTSTIQNWSLLPQAILEITSL